MRPPINVSKKIMVGKRNTKGSSVNIPIWIVKAIAINIPTKVPIIPDAKINPRDS